MSKKNQNYTNRKQNRFQPERMRGNVFVNNCGKKWLPGENGRATKVERLLRGTKEEKKEIAGNMAGYKDSGVEWIGAIPFDWDINRLQFCIDEISERNYVGKETHILSLMKDKGVIPYEEKGRVGNISKTDLTQYKLAYPNTLITNSMNIIIGSSGISQYKGCVSPAYYVFKAKPNNDIRYFNYIFAVRAFQNECRRFANGILEIRLRISSTNLLKIKVPIPPFEEQQRIADFLDTKCGILDRTIDAVNRQIEDLEKYKKALITKTVTKGICKKGEPERAMKDSGVEWIGEVPDEWDVSKVKYNFSTFKKIPGKESEKYERLSLTMNGVKHREKWTAEGLQPKDFMSYQLLRKGDLVFRLIDLQNPSKSRRVALSHDTGLISPAYTILHADNNKMLPEYAEMFFLMMSYLDVFNALGSCGVRSSINNAELMKIPILVPPLAEQQQIADYLDEKCKNIDNRVQKRRQQLAWLKEYKKSLIFDYVTGKKRV